jgi:hypothetical protein
MALYRYPVFASIIYLRVERSQPVAIIAPPMIRPSNIPSRTFFINNPTANPIMIAKMKAISPRLAFVFLSLLMIKFSSYRPHPNPSPKERGFRVRQCKKIYCFIKSPEVPPSEGFKEAGSKMPFSYSMQ